MCPGVKNLGPKLARLGFWVKMLFMPGPSWSLRRPWASMMVQPRKTVLEPLARCDMRRQGQSWQSFKIYPYPPWNYNTVKVKATWKIYGWKKIRLPSGAIWAYVQRISLFLGECIYVLHHVLFWIFGVETGDICELTAKIGGKSPGSWTRVV